MATESEVIMSSVESGLRENMSWGRSETLKIGHVMDINPNPNLVDLGKKLLDACRNGETDEVRTLMQSGAPFTTDWLGTSPLHFAAQFGHAETTEVLLRAGVSRDTRTKVDRTPLHVAAQEGHLAIVNLLIEHGADIDARDLLKMTPLHWAVERGHRDVVEALLTNGADVQASSRFDKNPIDVARDLGRLDLVPVLQNYSHASKPRQDNKSSSVQNVKARPTVLPNKANRTTTKVLKSGMKQIIFPAGFGKLPSTVEGLKKMFNSGDSNVMSAFQALADAASSNNNKPLTATEEAVQWLEQNVLGNSSGDDDTMFQSALESGQSVNLTEAGKLALDSFKHDQTTVKLESHHSGGNNNQSNPKVIRIVSSSDHGVRLPHIINSNNQSAPIVLMSGSRANSSESHNAANILKNRKLVKVSKPITLSSLPRNLQVTQVISAASGNSNSDRSSEVQTNEALRRQLAQCRRELETCQTKLEERDRENQLLKKQLEVFHKNHHLT